MAERLLDDARALQDRLIDWRRDIHANPETGMDLPRTQRLVLDALRAMGLAPEACGLAGVICVIEGAHPGKTFLLRADMDALPVREETGLAFASQNGKMHACGHDCHTAMLLGAAQLLAARRDQIHGRVKLMFQPGEETMEGAADMIEAGVLESPAVDAAMMIHILSGSPNPSGTCAVLGEGIGYASVDWFRIDIQGRGGHGASPHGAVSPLVIMADICTHIQSLVPLSISANESAVVSLGEMHGGEIANVIPDTATMAGTIRTFDPKVRQLLKERLSHSVPLIAQAKDGEATVTYSVGAPCVVSDGAVRADVLASVRALLGDALTLDLEQAGDGEMRRASGSEDFALVAERVPSAVIWLCAGTPEEGYCYPGHHPKVDFDEGALPIGSAIYAACAMDWLAGYRQA